MASDISWSDALHKRHSNLTSSPHLLTPMSLPDSEILTEFKKASQVSRRDFLAKLSSHLYPSDWHYLHHLLTTHSCYIDFLTALPVELSLQVLQHLTPVETILLRAVSRGYYSLLTSPETCRFLSHRFFPLCDIPADSCRIHYENIISRRLSFRRGRPTRFEEIPGGGLTTSFCTSTSTLASVADDTVRVHLLTTSPPTLILPPKRTSDRTNPIRCILTPAIVAVASNNGKCQIWDLSTHATHTVRLPSAPTSAIFGSGYILAMAICSDLLVYDAAQKKTKLFERVVQGSYKKCVSLIVHEPTRRVWVITSNFSNHTTNVMALCLDTGMTVVPAEDFNQLVAGRLINVGSGTWKMGCWRPSGDRNAFEVYQLRIDAGRTVGAVHVQEYPPSPLGMVPHVMSADSWESDRSVVLWEDVSWACLSSNVRFTWDRVVKLFIGAPIFSITGEISWWTTHAVCEEFLVVGDLKQNLGIFRFEGVHERLAEPMMTDKDNLSWSEGWRSELANLGVDTFFPSSMR